VQAPVQVGIQFGLLIRDLFQFGSRLLWFSSRLLQWFKVACVWFGLVQDSIGLVQGGFNASRLLQFGSVWFKNSSVQFQVASV
jgi:hypothetical protein